MMKKSPVIIITLVILGCIAAVFLLPDPPPDEFKRSPFGVMGTTCQLTAIASPQKIESIERGLDGAEAALRQVEVHMSRHLDASQIGALNAAPAGEIVELSPDTLQLIRRSRELTEKTAGAFDPTCLPIIKAWASAGKEGRVPSEAELALAKKLSGWEHFEFVDGGIRKKTDGAGIDFGGIAKGFGIDQAAEAMISAGIDRGLVNVGGDVRCFGRRKDGGDWMVAVENPFGGEYIAVLGLRDEAVCTSGNYERFMDIDGKRYSHIVDPRTGFAAEMTPSVTVIAPNATLADAWATALSVLGTDGLKLIDPDSGIEAMIVVGDPEAYEMVRTDGFDKHIVVDSGRAAIQ